MMTHCSLYSPLSQPTVNLPPPQVKIKVHNDCEATLVGHSEEELINWLDYYQNNGLFLHLVPQVGNKKHKWNLRVGHGYQAEGEKITQLFCQMGISYTQKTSFNRVAQKENLLDSPFSIYCIAGRHFKILALVMRDAFGDVYSATEYGTKVLVAIKVLSNNVDINTEMMQHFRHGQLMRKTCIIEEISEE